jgi:pimeloyl-ACP methyl ester carboxylesterase
LATLEVRDTTVHVDGPSSAPTTVEGAAAGNAASTIVMLHGWPDTAALWEPTVAALRDRWRCVRFTWPGFDARVEGKPAARVHGLDELLGRCGEVIDAVSPDRPVTLLVHDWGCFFGYQFAMRHPQRVARVIGIDVGDAGSSAHRAALSWKQLAGIAAYQLWLAAAWVLRASVGDAMTRRACDVLRAPTPRDKVGAHMAYPYFATWTGAYRRGLRPVRITCPMLFVWGTRKPFFFHSQAWVDELTRRPGSRALPLDTGHWVMLGRSQAFHAAVREWLSATEPAASA